MAEVGSCVEKHDSHVGRSLGPLVFLKGLLQAIQQQKDGHWAQGLVGRAQKLEEVVAPGVGALRVAQFTGVLRRTWQ